MQKPLLYSLLLAATMGLAACNDSSEDKMEKAQDHAENAQEHMQEAAEEQQAAAEATQEDNEKAAGEAQDNNEPTPPPATAPQSDAPRAPQQ